MNDRAKQVLVEIEQLRKQLTALVSRVGLDHPKVRNLSRKLDDLVNEYHRLTRDSDSCGSGDKPPSEDKPS